MRKTSTPPYVEEEEAFECLYRSFEVVYATFFPSEGLDLVHYLSKTSIMVAKTMERSDFQLYGGLGKDNQGNPEVPFLSRAKEMFGLGYRPTTAEWEKVRAKKREK